MEMSVDSDRRLLLLGDFNCPGTTNTCVDDKLMTLLSEYGLCTVNSQPICYNPQSRKENLLDLLIEAEDDSVLHSVVMQSVTFSDHRMVIVLVTDASGNPPSLWHTVNRLLHSGNAGCVYRGRHQADVAASFSAFCCDKWRHHHWNSSMSHLGAAADTSACRWES